MEESLNDNNIKNDSENLEEKNSNLETNIAMEQSLSEPNKKNDILNIENSKEIKITKKILLIQMMWKI